MAKSEPKQPARVKNDPKKAFQRQKDKFTERLDNEIYKSEMRSYDNFRHEESFKEGLEKAAEIFRKVFK